MLATGERVERELRDRHDRAFFLRILPYRAKGEVAGVVLTLIDVRGLKAAEDALFHERYLLNSLLGSVPDAIYFKDARGRFIRTNQAMAEPLGLNDPREAAGKTARSVSLASRRGKRAGRVLNARRARRDAPPRARAPRRRAVRPRRRRTPTRGSPDTG